MMRKITPILALLFLLAWQNLLCAQPLEPIGTITFMEGVCDIAHNNQEFSLISENEPVYVNDRIRTKSYSKAEITFADKSIVKLAPESCLTIGEYNLNGQKRREHSSIQLARGKIEAIVSKTGIPDTFVIETPNAQGAVKGSDVFVSYLGGRTGVFVREGAMSVLNPAVPDVRAQVVKGNAVLVNFKEAPGEVRPMRDTELDYFKRSVEPAFVKKWIPTKGAAQMNGVIVSFNGTVRLYKKGAQDWREPKLNETVSEGDKLQTEEEAMVKICLSNGNIVTLQAFTEMTFDTLRYDAASGSYDNTLSVTQGRLSAVVEKTTKQLTFKVKTPTAVCGVRGTFMEVVVNSAAQAVAAGAQAASAVQQATQVFFEGGNGYVDSILTGQTQEVGAGQNSVIDNLGNISSPNVTPPEIRNTMLQTWTSAQTMGSYSTAEGGAGMGGTTQEGTLPPQGTQPIIETSGGANLAPLADEIQGYLNIISTLTFDDLVNNPLVISIYNQSIPFSDAGGGGGYEGLITMDYFHLNIFSNNVWSGTTSGTWEGYIPETFWASFTNGADYVSFDVTSTENAFSGNISGSVYSGCDLLEIQGTIAGTATETGEGCGTFEGTSAGTWVVEPVVPSPGP